MPIEIGLIEGGGKLNVDLGLLIEGKMVVQSSSGGGKSMTIRTLLEKTHGKVPQIILDKDGEYSTLRERHDYVLAGKGGDTPALVETAKMLGSRVMKLDLSIIVDLYDLPTPEKHKFVRLFLESVFNAPKSQWHNRILVVDEAHRFCPENGEGVSEAKDIIIECCDDGRKRGLGMILATQRIAKLDKSALAECENKLIGRTNYDDDRRRAGKELGLSSKSDLLLLRDLKRGQFFAQGQALSNEVVKSTIHLAQTTHPRAGHRIVKKAPAPSAKIKAALAELKDLPQEAEAEAKTIAELQAQVRNAKAAQGAAEKALAMAAKSAPTAPKIDNRMMLEALAREHKEGLERGWASGVSSRDRQWRDLYDVFEKAFKGYRETWLGAMNKFDKTGGPVPHFPAVNRPGKAAAQMFKPAVLPPVIGKMAHKAHQISGDAQVPVGAPKNLSGMQTKILKFLAIRPGHLFPMSQVAGGCKFRVTSGSFKNAVANLNAQGYLSRSPGEIAVRPEAVDELGLEAAPSTMESWMARITGAERKILAKLVEDESAEYSVEDMAAAAEYAVTSGSYKNALAKLSSIGLMVRPRPGFIKFNEKMREEGIIV